MDGGSRILLPVSARVPAKTARRATRRLHPIVTALILPVVLLAIWQLTASLDLLPDQILPSPQAIYQSLRDGIADGSLFENTRISLTRVAIGVAAGALLGLLAGGAIGGSDILRLILQPSLVVLSQVPVFGWVPILVLVLGLGDAPKLIIIAWSAFIPVMLNTAQGIRDIPVAYRELGRVLAFSRWASLTRIVLPGAIPAIFTGLREGLANGWQALVAVELLGSFQGLGYMMAYGRQLFQLELVLSAALVIGLIGLALHAGLAAIERRLQRWRLAGAA